MLNNAKAVAVLDRMWAKQRGGVQPQALVELLRTLEGVPYFARREMARVIRAWLIRMIDLNTAQVVPVPAISEREWARVLDYIESSDTHTRGVIEQRVVDALAEAAYAHGDWMPGGLGDGVNVTNLSRRKIGDVDFTNFPARRAIGIEAHGGHVSRAYVNAHRASLGRVISQLLKERWQSYDNDRQWEVDIVFVAHSWDEGLPANDMLAGVVVSYRYEDYGTLRERAESKVGHAAMSRIVEHRVQIVLNRPSVRQRTRDMFAHLRSIRE